MKSTWKKYLLYAAYILITGGLFYGLLQLILSGYAVTWTGFQTRTLWDWMDLLIIPFVLALGVFFLNRSDRVTERERAENRAELERRSAKDGQQETALQAYLDRMTELLLNEKLQVTKRVEVRDVARTRTLTLLSWLNPDRKAQVVRFLYEADLINKSRPIIDLSDADLTNAYLQDAVLRGAELSHANLYCADLTNSDFSTANLSNANMAKVELPNSKLTKACLDGVSLTGADVTGAFLEGVSLKKSFCQNTFFCYSNLSNSDMTKANLTNADLTGANLSCAQLKGAEFRGADLSEANLRGAEVTPEQLAQAKSLKGATMPDGTIHE